MISRLRKFRKDKSGATAIEFAILAGPVLLVLLGTMEFSILLWRMSSLDHAALVLHREIRRGSTTAANYQQVFCDAGGPMVDCSQNSLELRVNRLTAQADYESERRRAGFSANTAEPFLMHIRYRHQFLIPGLFNVVPTSIKVSNYYLYGDYEL
jgi:Flp pilus assembly protein TadG